MYDLLSVPLKSVKLDNIKTQTMKKIGLIGYPLTHSFSKTYFTNKFDEEKLSDEYCYENFPIDKIEDLPALIKNNPDLIGLNVTIPYKESVVKYMDILDVESSIMLAVNTIRIQQDGKLKGCNTDFTGFRDTLEDFLIKNGGYSEKALILGTGGASKAVAFALEVLHIPYQLVSRTKGKNRITYEAISEALINESDLIINTTPLGMYPAIDSCPNIAYHCLTKNHRLYDLVYNPAESLFLKNGKKQGAAILNGLPMLHAQAEAAWQIWQY